ncbi:hypothetical protein TcasGA2_TC007858 [Tribolium castaneum]|uniref:Uncharacterized protein n=1 Tax=Tribolium castaneum TaxID=7070 RepID=D2A2I0_TRICA|nr:PREDICTED: uncharacterized protein LOC657017 [Tribolium castaneum]EFA02201.1 hypothetical protein TcasGA2_TC007858 [Tribolium castaneum]|eukprot:XP_015835005.1 PREDICTED: uncharacterized protein LOC657017 [Tribolium castaneum]
MKTLAVSLLTIFIFSVAHGEPDYYWRDYHGKIPADAIVGGRDSRGYPTYIGQAFVRCHGILIGQIYPGQKTITTSKEGIHVTDVYNRILCSGHKENFSWVPGNAATLHLTTINKHLVSGGTEWGKVLNIGRVKYQGELIVGKVCSGTIGKAKLYFPYKGEEIESDTYEVLAYEDKPNEVESV